MKTIMDFIKDEEGASVVEYSILVSLIAAVCILIVEALGINVSGLYSEVVANWQ